MATASRGTPGCPRTCARPRPYEESIHVPFVIRSPGQIPAGRRTSALLGSVDILPTLLGLCGQGVPQGVQGKDLSHVATGREGPLSDSVYLQNMGVGWPDRMQFTGFWRAVRTDRWLYARWLNGSLGPWLFDRHNDPDELVNLAGKKEHARVQQDLEARLRQWIEQTEDPFETGARDGVKGMLMLGQEFAGQRWKDLQP